MYQIFFYEDKSGNSRYTNISKPYACETISTAGETSPQLDTVIKLLAPLGKTLAVVPLEKE